MPITSSMYVCVCQSIHLQKNLRMAKLYFHDNWYWKPLLKFVNFSKFCYNQTTVTGSLHEDLHKFLCVEVTRWRIPSQSHNHVAESSMMTWSLGYTAARTCCPCKGHWPQMTAIIGTVYKCQILTSTPELLTMHTFHNFFKNVFIDLLSFPSQGSFTWNNISNNLKLC